MKFRLSYFALFVVFSSLVCAGIYFSSTQGVGSEVASSKGRLAVQPAASYDLVWNNKVGKFDAKPAINESSLLIEQLPVGMKPVSILKVRILVI